MYNYTSFPVWKPQRITKSKFSSSDFKIRLNALRNSSSAFIKKKEVREIVFSNDNHKCVLCGNTKNLTVDHKVSVYMCSLGKYPIEALNTIENFQTLCTSCNSKKIP